MIADVLVQRYLAKVIRMPDGCWGWQSNTANFGYGRVSVMVNGKRFTDRAHRVSWQIHFGEIPEGMFVLHRCDNPVCSNPEHLFLGTQADNMLDMRQKDRHAHAGPKGAAHPKAKLTEADVLEARRLHTEEGVGRYRLGRKYGISPGAMGHILSRKHWKHI